MRKDPTEFRKRFQSWKLGIPAYRAGKPIGEDEDTRSDTTREGYNERGVPYGAGRGPAGDSPLKILDIVNEETAAIPRDKVLIGEPPAVGLRNPGMFSSDFLARTFKPKGVGRASMFMTEEVRRNTANLKAALDTYSGKGSSLLTKQAKSWIDHNKGKIDLSLFSAEEINKLVKMNRRDLANANRDFVLVDRNPQAGNFEFDVMHNNQSVADMIGGFSGSHLVPEMVESYSKTGGMSRKLYDAAIQSGKQLGYNGLVSGEYLISAPKTWSVWKHYPDKKLISRNGRHLNRMMTNPDQEGQLVKSMQEAKRAAALNKNFTYDEGPVYLLKKESLFVPVKDKDVFDASILNPDGTFARDWNSKDITRIMLPFAVGGGLWGSKEHKNGKDLPRFADGDDLGSSAAMFGSVLVASKNRKENQARIEQNKKHDQKIAQLKGYGWSSPMRTPVLTAQLAKNEINPAWRFSDYGKAGIAYVTGSADMDNTTQDDINYWHRHLGFERDYDSMPVTGIRFSGDYNNDGSLRLPNAEYTGLSKTTKDFIRKGVENGDIKVDDTGKWTQFKEGPRSYAKYTSHMGNYSIRENNGSGIYDVFDTYDFPWYSPIFNRDAGKQIEIRDTIHGVDANPVLYDPMFSKSYKSGKDIYIKPSHRGRFTALKKRTGHSASWFKAHGTPALKKMATFALNARKWKH